MTKQNIIYHSKDCDGHCSAAIVKKYLLEQGYNDIEINMIPWDYGDPSPIQVDGDIYIVDLSLPENDMIALRSNIGDVTWIDHHKSAIQDSIGKWDWFEGIRRIGDSAAKLCWEYFYPDAELPSLVYYVDRYDVWKKDDGSIINWEQVMQMQWGIRSNLKDPSDLSYYLDWEDMLDSNVGIHQDIIIDGITTYNFIKDQNKIKAKRAFDLSFEGLKFCALNEGGNSEVVASVVTKDHDAIMMFRYDGIKWNVSMYGNELSDNQVDLSVIAKKFGGGGHAKACGFSLASSDKLFAGF